MGGKSRSKSKAKTSQISVQVKKKNTSRLKRFVNMKKKIQGADIAKILTSNSQKKIKVLSRGNTGSRALIFTYPVQFRNKENYRNKSRYAVFKISPVDKFVKNKNSAIYSEIRLHKFVTQLYYNRITPHVMLYFDAKKDSLDHFPSFMRKTLVKARGPLGGGIRLRTGKKGTYGLKVNAKTLGVKASANTSVSPKRAKVGGSFGVNNKFKLKSNTGLRYNNRLGGHSSKKIKFMGKNLLTTDLKANANIKNAGLEAKIGLMGLAGADVYGNVKYGQGIPSISGGLGMSVGKQRLGGGMTLGGPTIFDLNVDIPGVGRVVNVNTKRKSTKSKRKSTKTKKKKR